MPIGGPSLRHMFRGFVPDGGSVDEEILSALISSPTSSRKISKASFTVSLRREVVELVTPRLISVGGLSLPVVSNSQVYID